jgi:replicative DNA helicase
MDDDILTPPHDADAERSVIGSLLFMPAAIDEISAMLHVDSFYLVAHQNIYKAILSLHSRHVPAIDPVIVGDELQRKGDLDESGGLQYLFEILEQTPHASHVRFYASIVHENAMRRAVIYSAREAIRKAYDRTYAITDVAAGIVSTVDGVLGKGSEDVRSFADVVASHRVRKNNPLPPQSTGIRDVDDKLRPFNAPTGGFRPTQLIILGARPAMGKSAYVTGLIEAASDANIASLLLTLEMDGEDIAERIERVDSKRLDQLAQRNNIFIEDRQFELEQVIQTIRATHKRKQVRFVVIDYLGLIEVDSAIKDADKLSRITRRMKLLAKELRIPIVLAAQLNRDLEKRDNKRPQLSDIRGSGSIEQDADVVMFLYRHEVYYPEEKVGLAEVIIGKQRNGPIGAIECGYIKEQTRFVPKAQAPVDVDGFFKDEKPF